MRRSTGCPGEVKATVERSNAGQSYQQVLIAPPATVTDIVRLSCESWQNDRLSVVSVDGDWGQGFDIRHPTRHSIGRYKVLDLGNGRSKLVFIWHRGNAWEGDPGGEMLGGFLLHLEAQLVSHGLILKAVRFASETQLNTAKRNLDAADTPEAIASVGGICRTSLIALANELYDDSMLAPGEQPPEGSNAKAKFDIVARHYWAGGREDNQLRGIKRLVEGAWDQAAAIRYRSNPSKEEVQIVIVAVEAVFATFSHLIP